MDSNLQHEDLLIKLRAKLNEEKIKLWESPYIQSDNTASESLKDLANKYSRELSLDEETVLQSLRELQLHSVERSQANTEFNETGLATFRIRATVPGQKPKVMKIQKRLDVLGSDFIASVAHEVGVSENRIKLILNGKVIKPTPSLEEQGVKNGAQVLALIMAETPEEVKQEDNMYMEMKTTREDAALLSEYVNNSDEADQYIKLEDQMGNTVELPPAERKSLLVGLALHERGRAAAKQKDYSLALVLLLEADRQLSECRSSILKSVDNWAVLQLDIAWCYLCLQNLSSAADAAARLARAEESFRNTYGENHERLIALKGTAANERVLFMRLYLLQGIVAYHQNKRDVARRLLEKAETELNSLRVDEVAVCGLMELGWSRAQARAGLRASAGDVNRAHHYLVDKRKEREQAREANRLQRMQRSLGLCADGCPVNTNLVEALVGMGYASRIAALALQKSNNHVADAVRIIHEHPEMLAESDESTEESETPSSDDSVIEPDNKLLAELEGMGYDTEEAWTALRVSRNDIHAATELLVTGGGHVQNVPAEEGNPSTSSGTTAKRRSKKDKKHKRDSFKKREREMALRRLSSAIRTEEDDYLDTSLVEEEEFLAQYKSLL